jgi:cytochrome c-type biogenesis protein CcmH/NrfG
LDVIRIGKTGNSNMKISVGPLMPSAGVILVLLLCLAMVSCSRVKRDDALVEQLAEMEGEAQGGVSMQRVEELQGEIRRFSREVERCVAASGQLAVYYKMLAVEYMRGAMYQAAFQALEQAIAIEPENPILFYYSAVCAARMSKAQVISEDRTQWLERSEALYRRAIILDPGYADALYGLSVLYIFELDRPAEAEDLLERLLTVESKNIDGRFLLARVYYSLGKLEKAIEIYKEIESLSSVKEKREQAMENRKQIERELYGAQ